METKLKTETINTKKKLKITAHCSNIEMTPCTKNYKSCLIHSWDSRLTDV